MIRRLTLPLLLLLVAGLVLPACGKDENGTTDSGSGDGKEMRTSEKPAATGDTLSRLCPEGAMAFIRIESLADIDEEVAGLVRIFDERAAAEAVPSKGLEQVIPNPGLPGLSRDRPVGVALFMSGQGPVPVMLLPLDSRDEFQAGLEASESWKYMKDQVGLAYVGDYAVWAQDKSLAETVKLREAPIGLVADTLPGDLSFSLDMAAIYQTFAGEIDQIDAGFAELERTVANAPGAMPGSGQMIQGMAGMAKSFFTDSEWLGLSFSLDAGDLLATMSYRPKAESGIADYLATAKPVRPDLVGKMGLGDFMVCEMHYSPENMWKFFRTFYGWMLENAPEYRAMMEKSIKLADGFAMGVDLSDGLEMVGVYHVTDGEEYEKLVQEMIPAMQGWMEKMIPAGPQMPISVGFSAGEPWTHAGTTVRPMTMTFDVADDPNLPPEAKAEMDEMFTRIFGEDGFVMHTAVAGEHAVTTVGPNAKFRMQEMLDRLKAGESAHVPAAYGRATAGFPETVNGVFYMNLAGLAKMIGNLPIDEIPPPMKSLLQSPPQDLSMAGYMTVEGGEVKMGMRMKLGEILEYVKAFLPK